MDGSFDGQRLAFSIASAELWTDWCAMQDSFVADDSPDVFSCVPFRGFSVDEDGGCAQSDPIPDEDVPIDCGKLFLCMDQNVCVCVCDAAGCAARPDGTISFDIETDADEADGTLIGIGGDSVSVRLVRE